MSRASSTSSSPRYSAGLMAQVAAAMAASGGQQGGSPTGAAMQSYIRAQQQRQQQAALGQSFGTNAAGLGASGCSSALGGSGYGALRPGGGASSVAAPRSAYGPQRHGPLAPHVSGWTQQGEIQPQKAAIMCVLRWFLLVLPRCCVPGGDVVILKPMIVHLREVAIVDCLRVTGLQAQPQLYKHAVAGAARQRQSGSPASYQQQPQPQRTSYGGYLQMLAPISVGAENRAPGSFVGARSAATGACPDPWVIASTKPSSLSSAPSSAPVTPPAPCTPPAVGGPARVPPFPAGALLAAQEQHGSSMEAEFWRTSPRDNVVEGFKGPSPFGPIGPAQG